jgi:hypothetical protein
VPPGERVLALERLGYRSVQAEVALAAGAAVELEVRLEPMPVEVPAVSVELAVPPDLGIGLVRHVITAEDIPRETPISVVQLIGRRVPGVRIGQMDDRGCPLIQTRNGPVDLVVLDGQPFGDTCILHHLLPTDILRLETRIGLNSALDLGRSRGAAIVIETFHGSR